LDAFAGSGTTAVASEQLGREGIAIDNSPLAIATIVQRLAIGSEPMGDFVGARVRQPSMPLFQRNRVLFSGLELYVDDCQQLSPIPEERWRQWRALFVSDDDLWGGSAAT